MRWLNLLLAGLLAGCAPSREVCCELASGAFGVAPLDVCEGAGGGQIDAELCEVIGDPDLVFPPADTTGDPVTCSTYCVAIREVCPSDDACEHSCDEAPTPPSDEAQTCAEDAADCTATGACWNLLGL